jgi:hypothetical protein
MPSLDIYERIIQVVEKDLSFDLANYSPQIKPLLNEWQTSHPGETYPMPLMWELTALDARPDIRKERKSNEPYFVPLVEMVDRDTDPSLLRIYPDVQGTLANDDAVAYYISRYKETSNIIRKTRFADLLWEALKSRKSKEAYKYGLEAANLYIFHVSLCLEQKSYTNLVNHLGRSAEIALSLNAQDIADDVVRSIVKSIPILFDVGAYYYISDLVAIVAHISTIFPNTCPSEVWIYIRDVAFQVINNMEKQQPLDDILVQAMIEVVIVSSKNLGDGKTVWEYRVKVAEINETVSKTRELGTGVTKGSLVAVKFMEDALHIYQNLLSSAPNEQEKNKMADKVEEIKREVRRLLRQSEEEMHTISVTKEVPRELLDSVIKPLLEANLVDVIPMLSSYPYLTPDISELRKQSKQIAEKAPLTSLLGKTHLRDGRIVDETPPFSNEDSLTSQMDLWFQIHAKLLDFVFYRLKEASKLSADSILAHIKAWEFLDERDLPFLEKALIHYFSEDHLSALHILVPRIEHMLKSAFEQVGLPSVAVPNERQFREQTFGDFLRRDDVRKALGESIWHYLYFALVDESGLNLRNDIAHGWITIETCNRVTVQVSIYCVLLVTRLQSSPPEKPSS